MTNGCYLQMNAAMSEIAIIGLYSDILSGEFIISG